MNYAIELIQSPDNDDDYIVNSLTNRMQPKVGSVLTPKEVEKLIMDVRFDRANTGRVNIKRRKK